MKNIFKKRLAAGDRVIGLWNSLCSPIVTEMVSGSGFDWLLIDMEHTPNDVMGVMSLLQAAKPGMAAPIVRPPWNDAVVLKRLLDIGCQNFLIPFVQNAQEAALAVAATRYPPQGIRGVTTSSRATNFGRITDYLACANSEICVLVQIETGEALKELEAIASLEGVDGVFIGPSDLAASLGHIGNSAHRDVQVELENGVKQLKRMGKPAGILAPQADDARRYLDMGYSFVAVGSDMNLLVNAADALSKQFAQL